MVEVWIEEMCGSDRNRPKRLQTSRGHRHWAKEQDEGKHSSEERRSTLKKLLTEPTLLEIPVNGFRASVVPIRIIGAGNLRK